jgi:hypothetical protein
MFRTILTTLVVFSILSPVQAGSTKNKRDMMTAAQKADLRKRAWDYCKKHLEHGATRVTRVEILTTGAVRCWYQG